MDSVTATENTLYHLDADMPIRENTAADDEADLQASGPMWHVLKTYASRLDARMDPAGFVDPPSDYTPPGRFGRRMTSGGRAPRSNLAEQRRPLAAADNPVDQDDPEDPRSDRAQHEESYLELRDYDQPGVSQPGLTQTSQLSAPSSAPSSALSSGIPTASFDSGLSDQLSTKSDGTVSFPELEITSTAYLDSPSRDLQLHSFGVMSSIEDIHTFQRTETENCEG